VTFSINVEKLQLKFGQKALFQSGKKEVFVFI